MGIKLSKEDLEQFIGKISNEVEQAKQTVVVEADNKDVVSIHRGRVGRLDSFAKAFSFKKAAPTDQEQNNSTVVDFKSAAKTPK